MPGIPPSSSSTHLSLCEDTRHPMSHAGSLVQVCVSRASPFVLCSLISVHVLQFVQLRVQDGDVGLGLQQGRAQQLVLLCGGAQSFTGLMSREWETAMANDLPVRGR